MHYPLTYEKLASYDFDPNAEYLYALELLPELGKVPRAPAPTVSLNDSDLSGKLDREIERVFRQSDSPGLAVGVIKDQELVYAKGFGVMNLETEIGRAGGWRDQILVDLPGVGLRVCESCCRLGKKSQ